MLPASAPLPLSGSSHKKNYVATQQPNLMLSRRSSIHPRRLARFIRIEMGKSAFSMAAFMAFYYCAENKFRGVAMTAPRIGRPRAVPSPTASRSSLHI